MEVAIGASFRAARAAGCSLTLFGEDVKGGCEKGESILSLVRITCGWFLYNAPSGFPFQYL